MSSNKQTNKIETLMFSVIFQTKFYYFWPIVDRFEVTVLIKLTRIQSKVKHCIQNEIKALNIAVMIYLSQLNAVFFNSWIRQRELLFGSFVVGFWNKAEMKTKARSKK